MKFLKFLWLKLLKQKKIININCVFLSDVTGDSRKEIWGKIRAPVKQ